MYSGPVSRFLARWSIHYGWVMVAITFVTMLATAAAMGMPGILIVPLRQEFGWGTGSISGAMALRLLLFGLVGPFAAALMQRYGVRATIATALLLIVLGLGLASRMTALWQLWICWGVLVGMGTGMTAIVLGATVAARWFTARRGFVLGLLTASAATGQLVFLPVAAWLAEHCGWRMAVLPAVAACAVAAVLFLLFGVDDPARLGLLPYGETVDEGRHATSNVQRTGAVRLAFATLGAATGARMFWILFLTFAICGFTTNGLVQTHFVPLCQDFGMPELDGAKVLALMGVFDFFGTIAAGWLSDRYDNRWLLFWYYGLRGVALAILPFSTFTVSGLSLFSMFYGLEWIATVPSTVKLAATSFGRDRAPLVFGWIFTAHQLGAAIAALGAGITRDLTGSYLPAFYVGAVACLLAACAAVTARPGEQRPARDTTKALATHLAPPNHDGYHD
jgi:MFS family permease